MANTTTANYAWQMPDPGGSPNTWGNTLNGTTQAIDAQVFLNQQAGVPVGAIMMWPTSTPPANWMIFFGQSVNVTDYPALYAVLGTTFNQAGDAAGTFRLPPGVDMFPVGAGDLYPVGSVGGEAAHTLVEAEMAYHTHGINDPGHAHGVYDPTHYHPITDVAHSHGASQSPHAHTYSEPNIGSQGMAAGGSFAGIIGATTGPAQPAVTFNPSGTGLANTGYAATNVQVEGAATGVSAAYEGGSQPHNNMPPYFAIYFIIKYQ